MVLVLAMLSATPGVVASMASGVTPAPKWWTAVASAALVSVLGALVAAAVRRRDPTRAAASLVVVVCLILATYPTVAHPARVVPWMGYLVPAAATACAIGFSARRAPVAGLLLIAAQAWAQLSPAWSPSRLNMLMDALFDAVVVCAVLLPVEAIRSRARSVALARDAAIAAAVRAAETSAAELESSRWNALVHDDVLAVLTQGGNAGTGQEAVKVAVAARLVLHRVVHDPSTAAVGPSELADRLREVVVAACNGARVTVLRDDGAAQLSADVADALVMATAEAARNASRHAWTSGEDRANRFAAGAHGAILEATIRLTAAGTQVDLTDNGIGFDSTAVPADRLGMAVSVRARLRAVGGEAHWDTRIGQGTTVRLWLPGNEP